MSEVWQDDAIQFPRLLAEISALGLSQEDKAALCESMDLEPDELESLFIRAERRWEAIKAARLSKLAPGEQDEPLLHVQYRCPNCGHDWQEESTSACDSECPECGTGNITALSSQEVDLNS